MGHARNCQRCTAITFEPTPCAHGIPKVLTKSLFIRHLVFFATCIKRVPMKNLDVFRDETPEIVCYFCFLTFTIPVTDTILGRENCLYSKSTEEDQVLCHVDNPRNVPKLQITTRCTSNGDQRSSEDKFEAHAFRMTRR